MIYFAYLLLCRKEKNKSQGHLDQRKTEQFSQINLLDAIFRFNGGVQGWIIRCRKKCIFSSGPAGELTVL